jgi:hypothetical protein
MDSQKVSKFGRASLWTSIAGAVSLGTLFIAPAVGYREPALLICAPAFLVLELLALILGMVGKGSVSGKLGLALSAIFLGLLMALSALVLLF